MQLKQVFEHYPRSVSPTYEFKFCPLCGAPLRTVVDGDKSRPTCSRCGFIQYHNPAPAVSVLVVDEERVLLGKRGGEPGKGTWSLPSGYVEYEEDFLTAAVRETKEETGLDVEVRSIINVVSSFVTPRLHFLGVYVVARVVAGELMAGDDLETVAWFPITGTWPDMGFAEDVSVIKIYARGFEGLPVDRGSTR